MNMIEIKYVHDHECKHQGEEVWVRPPVDGDTWILPTVMCTDQPSSELRRVEVVQNG